MHNKNNSFLTWLSKRPPLFIMIFIIGTFVLCLGIVKAVNDAYLYGSWSVEIFPDILLCIILKNEGLYFVASAVLFTLCFFVNFIFKKHGELPEEETDISSTLSKTADVSHFTESENLSKNKRTNTKTANPFEK